ncbi:MtrAB system histidine kinase MtrB [Nesterenkonia massiliensis]
MPKLWAQSLMFRAVFYTGLFTVLGTGLITYFLVQQVTTGLYQERLEQVQIEATTALVDARNQYESLSFSEPQSEEAAIAVLDNVGGPAAQQHRGIILIGLEDTATPYMADTSTAALPLSIIGSDLRESVLADRQSQFWQPVGIPVSGGQPEPGIVFGMHVSIAGQSYGLFFVYDFSSVQENIHFVFRIFIIAAAAMLLLNILIAAWVARTVVRPVSYAAEVSERIAEGQLEQRLAVVGEDEIARLGVSFNRMASTLQEQITQLANLSKMQQRFVSDVSHELRTPLTTISMAASMLHESREDFDPISQRSTELLHHQVERFQALLADLLEMSRFDAGAAELSISDVDLLSLAREVLIAAAPLAEQAGAEMNIVVQREPESAAAQSAAGEGDFIAEVDRRRIDRILRNLINNAIEHAEGRPVDLIIAASPTSVGIAVRDHGIGMTPAEVAHVFDRFWRADPARARTTGGSGLGLSIATEDTRLHQGSLDAWGQKGQGSCFRLVLPRHQGQPYRAAPLSLPPVYRPQDRERITAESQGFIVGEITHDRVHEQSLYPQEDSS